MKISYKFVRFRFDLEGYKIAQYKHDINSLLFVAIEVEILMVNSFRSAEQYAVQNAIKILNRIVVTGKLSTK